MFIDKNLESFNDVGGGHGGLSTESDISFVKEILEVLYNDDEGPSLLDQYQEVKKFVTA